MTSRDSGSDDGLTRTSGEVRQHDRETITAEEAERLLTPSEKQRDQHHQERDGDSDKRRKRRKSGWLGERDGETAVLYKVERGGGRSSSAESSANSSEVDIQHLAKTDAKRKVCRIAQMYRRSSAADSIRSPKRHGMGNLLPFIL